jgi:HSP20 family molecular chaperone IbpA
MDSISSKLEDGVLTIKVPRMQKAETKKVIQIQ